MNQPDLFDTPFNLAPEIIQAPAPAPARQSADLIGALAACAELRTIARAMSLYTRSQSDRIAENIEALEGHLADADAKTAASAANNCATLAYGLLAMIPNDSTRAHLFAACVNARVALLEYEWTTSNRGAAA